LFDGNIFDDDDANKKSLGVVVRALLLLVLPCLPSGARKSAEIRIDTMIARWVDPERTEEELAK